MNWQKWLEGLLSAIIGGAGNSITVMAIDPAQFNFAEGLPKLATVAGVSALLCMAAYLKEHPIPEWRGEERRTR